MTLRRRFFPAQAVQQLPGRTLELSAQLRPEGEPLQPEQPQEPITPPSGDCQPAGITWMPPELLGRIAEDQYNGPEYISIEPGPEPEQWDVDDGAFILQGTPTRFDSLGRPMVIPHTGWDCRTATLYIPSPLAGISIPAAVYGAPLGAIRWELAWSDPAPDNTPPYGTPWQHPDAVYSSFGHVAMPVHNLLWVTSFVDGSGDFDSVLTATAWCDDADQPIGTLRLTMQAWW